MPPSWNIASSIVVAVVAVFVLADFSSLASISVILQLWPGFLQTKTNTDWNVMHHQGGNSPWFRKTDGTVDEGFTPPDDCRVEQVHMISRHAERYPTYLSGSRMLDLYNRIHQENATLKGDLAFIAEWPFLTPDPDPPEAFLENLISTGAYAGTLQAFTTGLKLRTRYRNLLVETFQSQIDTGSMKPISFWSSEAPRVAETARYFASGFFGIDWSNPSSEQIHDNFGSQSSYPAKHITIPTSSSNGANTLTPGKNCPNYYDRASVNNTVQPPTGRVRAYEALTKFRSQFLPRIISRLQEQNPHFPFSENEVYSMLELCGFDTMASPNNTFIEVEGRPWTSPWCDVFQKKELEEFEYARDLLHYYRSGPGNTFSETLGKGWVNATAELLQAGPQEGRLFFSFAHDTDLLAIMTALSLFPKEGDLPTDQVFPERHFRSSSFLPMHGRLIIERLACPIPRYCWSNAPFYPNHVYCSPEQDDHYVRINVNDGIMAVSGCQSGPGRSCPLQEFTQKTAEWYEGTHSFVATCGLEDGAPEKVTFLKQP